MINDNNGTFVKCRNYTNTFSCTARAPFVLNSTTSMHSYLRAKKCALSFDLKIFQDIEDL